jgi:hypothetical protein
VDKLASVHGLDCAGGDFAACHGDRSACEAKGGHYLGQVFRACPVREIMDDHHLQAGLMLDRQMDMNPIEGWPDGWASWVFDILTRIRTARASREAGAIKSASRR